MYGTVAKVRAIPGKGEELIYLMRNLATPPGLIARYFYQLDSNPEEFILAVIFVSREYYWASTKNPAQHERYLQYRALLTADPEWQDGDLVDAFLVKAHVA